jgi:hypothetical protein
MYNKKAPMMKAAAITPITIPAIVPPEKDGLDELEFEDDTSAVDVFVAGIVGETAVVEDIVAEVGIDDVEDEPEASSSFVNIWMLW